MSQFFDDKPDHCVTFILDQISSQNARNSAEGIKAPYVLFVGLNGLQGVGKTTLVGHNLLKPFLLYAYNIGLAMPKINVVYTSKVFELARASNFQESVLYLLSGIFI